MVAIPAGRFRMGADDGYPEEAPSHLVEVDAFRIDRTPVTTRDFAAFVAATGHVTTAEIAPRAEDYPAALPQMLFAGSLVFRKTRGPVDTADWSQWWELCRGADWRHPYGPTSTLAGLGDHPVVHVSHADARAYADWAGKDLPTEAEFEYAARGGLEGATYAWGEVFRPGGRHMANTWQGRFPFRNTREDGWEATSPVASYPANGHGVFDLIGNVWEWTQDWYQPRHAADPARPCCIPRNPRGPQAGTIDPAAPIPQKVLKGGSFLCAPSYCRRYRPAARHAESIDTSTCHIGFRCVVR
ncbi:formylglycine-generating enzyme family protein [Polymorphobacter fuscus]|uniref:SUMF1/EgtB/PvdO family nonheme iron enzyme n=1 Tax=Sandarakinorhabdus fusca TaxID=1439888 RepID=A0A7C9KM37_9SPHN|nr:formylglycine-generating enzyme family protein [Polymorphobacter fuscus]KAB7646599.1 formylglycine-generating enzyme family protein [Polymorphobacter fuscus]MQT17563.1 SUMF1/EgtB/PvdO family nonheme iron enzyme [Polymorphobacter fuscus]